MTLRMGVLGCARIAPLALVRPARKTPGVEVVAVGSRSLPRAQRWAKRHRIPRAYGSYHEVLADRDVDAVYIPLPNSLHASWAITALDAGKHVLCEKPLAATEDEAEAMADAADRSGLVAMEAFHYRYHPLADRLTQIISSGELGELRRLEMGLSVPVLDPRDIRWNPGLAGGAAMDVGPYAVDAARFLIPGEPEMLTAVGSLTRRGVDRTFRATLRFPRDVEVVVRGSLLAAPWSRLDVEGTRGRISVLNPILPQVFYRLRVTADGTQRRERVSDGTTYGHQLAAFAAAVHEGHSPRTSFRDGVPNLRIIDQIRMVIGVRPAASS